MDISCAFAPGLDTPEHIALAERLGYRRAWCYDSPALYADVWMTLARAAERTRVIGLGPGVLIPSLRHVMTTAAAIATLEGLAPGRVAVAVGSGFTGRVALGQRPLPWARVRDAIVALRALLRGEEIEWDGAVIRMLHPTGFAPARPIIVPVLVGADGPKGLAVAREVGDGIMGSARDEGFSWVAQLAVGTVLDEGEDAGSARAVAAAGHAVGVAYHFAYEHGRVRALPDGDAWAARAEAVHARTRHLAIHDRHLVAPNALDRPLLTGEAMVRYGGALSAADWRARLARLAERGATEVAYQPAGLDIPRELRAFAAMAGLQART